MTDTGLYCNLTYRTRHSCTVIIYHPEKISRSHGANVPRSSILVPPLTTTVRMYKYRTDEDQCTVTLSSCIGTCHPYRIYHCRHVPNVSYIRSTPYGTVIRRWRVYSTVRSTSVTPVTSCPNQVRSITNITATSD